MDSARYAIAVLTVTFLPPALGWWLAVHPFVAFWRRLGATPALAILTAGAVAGIVGLMTQRHRLVMTDLGTHTALLLLAAVLLTGAARIALLRRKHLTLRIMAGVPELERGGRGGALLSEGIYGVIRHPRYVEIVLGVLAYAVFANHLGSYAVAAATAPAIHLIVLLEERELVARFGAEYEEYRRRVPRYLPRRRSTSAA
jgi:protein-S-isoprenylcysteine O-methyltransferase Ste14